MKDIVGHGRGASMGLATCCAFLCGSCLVEGATLVHDFYLPMPEAQIRQTFTTLETGVGATLDSIFSVVVTGEGTVIYYDQWEDGYEIDISQPAQASTQIWGDGNNFNGIPPGYTNDPPSFAAGSVLALRNLVPLPRNPANLLFDGRDRMAATKALVVSRAAWATSPGPVLAGAVEVTATIDYGTSYISPVGQDMTNGLFQYVGLMVMAQQDGTSVTIDTDGPGVIAPVTTALNRGESYLVNGGVRRGGRVTANRPVQVNLVIGRIGGRYATDWFTLYPTNQWSDSYYTPVGTASGANTTFVYLYNPTPATITINYATRVGSGSFTVASNGVYQFQMPQNSGARFSSAGGQAFFALSTAGANPSSDAAYDWGFTLMPADGLTPEAVVGWGPGSSDGTRNGSPVWITPVSATRVYVDYDGDRLGPLTDPRGSRYDVHYDMVSLESRTVFDPDLDQTAMRLYTTDGTDITAAWGEDPSVASPGNPYLDFGTTVLPFPVPVLRKTSVLAVDNGSPGLTIGDVLEYTIELDNRGLLPLGNVVVIDAPSPSVNYVTNSTSLDGTPVADSVSGTPFPLDAPGFVIPIILRAGTSVFKYRVTVVTGGAISNVVSSSGYNLSAQNTVIPGGSSGCALEFTDSTGTPVGLYAAGTNLFARLTDADANTASNSLQSVTVVVRNVTRGDLETVVLTETGPNTGVFRNVAGLASSVSGGLGQEDGTLNVSPADTLSVSYTDPAFGDTCSANAVVQTPALTKVLYLSTDGSGSPDQDLDRINPAATPVDNTTAQTAAIGLGTGNIVAGTSSSTGVTSTASVTLTHTTAAGANRLLMVSVAYVKDQNTRSVNSVTYGSQSLTFRSTQSDAGNEVAIDVWSLVAPNVGTTNVVVTLSGSCAGIVVGASSFTGVDQTTPLGTAATAQGDDGNSPGNPSVTVASATGQLVFDAVSRDDVDSLTAGPGQTQQLNTIATAQVRLAVSTEPGAASVTNSWTSGDLNEGWAAVGIPIRAAPTGTNAVTFTQTPVFCQHFVMPSNNVVSVTGFVAITSGSMPANPAITARLRYGSTVFLALTNPVFNSGASNLVWNGVLSSNVTVPSGQAMELAISNAQGGVTFQIDYDSATRPSKILLPTTSIINVSSLAVYDAPYPGGSVVTTPVAGSTLYVRASVTDPFGSYDVTSLNLGIDGPGAADVNITLTNNSVVADNGCAKTYEYTWQTGSTIGSYNIAATANEGSEGITHTGVASITLTVLDTGTPSVSEFTSGNNGPATNSFPANSSVCARVTDVDQNGDPLIAEFLTVVITTSSGDSEVLTLTETGTNSGVFTACLATSTSGGAGANNGVLNAPQGSVLTLAYADPNDPADQSTATGSILTPPATPSITMNKLLVAPTDGQAGVGESIVFNLQVINSGSTTLSNISVTDTFPASAFSFQSASPAPNTIGSGLLTWTNIGPLTPGQSSNLVVSFTATNAAASAVNSATANGGTTTNTGTASIVVTRSALTITKTLLNPTSGPVNIGDSVTFRIEVANSGDTVISALPLEDTFSASCLQFVSATLVPDGIGAGSLLWNDVTGAGSLATNASLTIDVTFQVTGGCDPANNTARADFALDGNGDPIPPAVSTAGVTTGSARITGSVYNDVDQSGSFTIGDAGLGGVTIELFSDPNADGDPADGALLGLTATDASGYYELLNLNTGRYVVVETDLPGFASVVPANNRLAMSILSLTTNANNNFFDYQPSPTNYATVSGRVWADTNASGTIDPGETGLGGVTIDLVQDVNTNQMADVGEPTVASTLTDTNGVYAFINVIPGNYVVVENDLFGYVSTADTRPPSDNQIGLSISSGAVTNDNDFLDFFTGNNPGNDAPLALGDNYTTAEDVLLIVNAPGLLGNDSDVDGDDLTAILVAGPLNGTLTLSTNGGFIYTPASNYFGLDSFTYRASDGQTNSGITTVAILVTAVNDPPVAVNDSITTPEDIAVTISVLANDNDPEGTSLTITGATATNGIVSVVGTNLVYTPGTNFYGVVTIIYTISDGTNSASANVLVTVTPVNDAPIAVDDFATTAEDTPVTVNVLVNDSDPEGSLLTIVSANTTNGTVSVAGTNLVYSPSTNFNGVVTLTYTVTDGTNTSGASVVVTIGAANDPPVALNDAASTPEDTSVTISVLANDSDPEGTPLTIVAATTTNGTVNIVGTNLVYNPGTNFYGVVNIDYTTSDGTNTANANATVTVTPVNDPPVAVNDSTTTLEDMAVTISVLANDSDPEGTPLTITGATATNGTVSVVGTNLVYTPGTNFYGVVMINYTISDGTNTASANVLVTVTPVNDAPISVDDLATTPENTTVTIGVLANDSDPEGSLLTILSANTTNGTVSVVGTNLVYSPSTNFNGVVTLTYTVTDGTNTASANVTVTVTAVNDPPVAVNDSTTTPEDIAVTISVLANDNDPEGTSLTITGATATNGTVSVVGTNLVYTPGTNFYGVVTIIYTISDGTNSASANVLVTVTPVNDAPIAVDDFATTAEDTPVTVNVLVNDSDPEGSLLTIVSANTTNGTVSVAGTNLVYSPSTNFNGVVTLTYTVTDGTNTSGASVVVTIGAANDPPVALNDVASTPEDTSVTISVLANDSDPEGTLLTITSAITFSGIVSVAGTNLVFTPATNFNGNATISYTVSDGTNSASANVTVTVTPVNDAPTAVDDFTTTPEDTPLTISVLVNDSDPEAAPLTISGATTTNGTVTIVGTNVVFTPATNFGGNVAISYTISDGTNTASANVTVTVTPVNDPPLAVNDNATTPENTTVTISVLVNDSDVEGTPLTISGATTTNGTVSVVGTNVVFTPATNFSGNVTLGYAISDGTNTATATIAVTVTFVATVNFGILQGPNVFNPQTGLFEQRATVTNIGSATAPAVRLLTGGLRSGVRLWNAVGTNFDSRPFVQHNAPLDPGSNVTFRLEFYVPDRLPFTNSLEAQSVTPVSTSTNSGGSVTIDRAFADTRIPGEPRYVIEFTSIPNRTYTVIYSDDGMVTWRGATPSIVATSTRTQWYDDGPPKTGSKPLTAGNRFYRVILAP